MLTEEESSPPSEAAASAPEPTSLQLRKFFARHNQQALLLAFFSLVGAILSWGMIYLGVYWFTLVAVTVGRSLNPATLSDITQRNLVGLDFPARFAVGAAIALAFAAFLRKKVDLDVLREHRHYFLWVVAELFMAVPNVTFSIWGNLSAVCRLRRGDMEQAWRLLRRMEDAGGRLSMASLPLEIQDPRALGRVVFALQLVGLVGVREKDEGWFLYIQNRNALSLRSV